VHCVAFSNNHEQEIGKPDIVMNVEEVIEKKMNAIQAHRSQFQAAELVGKQTIDMQQSLQRFGREPFWTYQF
jgi:LmbE family N-acetylglucosaminyl deacetylase